MQDPQQIFNSGISFWDKCLRVYSYQFLHQPVYNRFAGYYFEEGQSPANISEIPLLPIRGFKDTELIVEGKQPDITFKSSGTGSMKRSRHPVADLDLYKQSVLHGFEKLFNLSSTTILCYTPEYNDNPDSSLLYMLQYLINQDKKGLSRFLPLEQPLRSDLLRKIEDQDRTILLFGAAFGLLDLIEAGSCPLPQGSSIIETGGMKTHRREMTKQELRKRLSEGFDVPSSKIHSEYGMCELLSQLYSIGGEWFTAPGWVDVSIRDPQNPFRICSPGMEGKIGIIDLANLYSCPFILTEDRGVADENGRIAVLGRWPAASLRGCNFLIDRD